MDESQALTKAKKLWGPYSYVLDRESSYDPSGAIAERFGRFYVGNPSLGEGFPYGNGNTWEEAFSDVAKH
jgi:hypothetical protein